jgi:hypothetical protein
MSIKNYFKAKDPVPNEDMEIDIMSQNEDSSDMDLNLEEELQNNHKYTKKTKLYKKSRRRVHFRPKKTGFQKEWLKVYSWLIYDASKNLMFCSLCQMHKKQNRFGKEGKKFYLNIIKIIYLI